MFEHFPLWVLVPLAFIALDVLANAALRRAVHATDNQNILRAVAGYCVKSIHARTSPSPSGLLIFLAPDWVLCFYVSVLAGASPMFAALALSVLILYSKSKTSRGVWAETASCAVFKAQLLAGRASLSVR